jgi:cytochrome c oxidase subunit 2
LPASKLRPLALLAVPAAFLTAASPAAASVLSPRAAHSPNAHSIRVAYWVALILIAIIAAVVLAALLTAVFRFREERGREPRRLTGGRGAFLRAGIPLALLAVGIFVFGIVKTGDVRDVQLSPPGSAQASSGTLVAQVGVGKLPPAAAIQNASGGALGEQPLSSAGGAQSSPLEINAVGQQWLWRFDYPNSGQTGPPYDTFSFNELVVPVDTTVVLNLTSTDVIHRWFVPALGGQVDAVPGQTTQTWFRADHTGVFPGQSMAFSGPSFPAMRIWVRVVTPDEYQAFLKQKRDQIQSAQNFIQNKIQKQATVGGVKLP